MDIEELDMLGVTSEQRHQHEHRKLEHSVDTLRKSQFVRLGELQKQLFALEDRLAHIELQHMNVGRGNVDICIHESTNKSKKLLFA